MKKLLCLLLCLALLAAVMPGALAAEGEPVEPVEFLESAETEGFASAGLYASEPAAVAAFSLDGAAGGVKLNALDAYQHNSGYAAHSLSKGIDVSVFQGSVDWSRVKGDGVDFAIVRVGGRFSQSGLLYADKTMEKNLRGAIAQGIETGAYFFSQAVTEEEAREEAAEAIRLLGDWARLLKLPIYMDMEYVNDAGRLYDAELSKQEHTKIALAFCEAIEQAGYKAGVYAGFCTFPLDAAAIADAGYEVWHAQWYSKATISPVYTMWQFSENGSVSGISDAVDLNFRYTKSESNTTTTAPVEFTDVAESAWYHDHVDFVVRRGLFLGMGNNRFAPLDAMNREMFVVVLYRLAGEPAVSGESPFSDVKNSASWYYNAVLWGAENNIVTGIGGGQFGVGSALTRQEMVTLLCRYAAHVGLNTEAEGDLAAFPDGAAAQFWAQDALCWAVENGIVSGVLDPASGVSTLEPAGTSTRAQVAAVIERFAGLLEAQTNSEPA